MKYLIIVFVCFCPVCFCIDQSGSIIINKTVTVGPNTPGNNFDYHSINAAIMTECGSPIDDGGVKFIVYDHEYDENISIDGSLWDNKSIIIESESGIPAGCIIDGNNNNPCIYIIKANVWLMGLALKNGKGKLETIIGSNYYLGGGILALPSKWIKIDSCVFEDNITHGCVSRTDLAYGGGCYLRPYPKLDGTERLSVAITGCKFYRNFSNTHVATPDTDDNCWGGAIFACRLKSASIIQSCLFEDNWADDFGGAVYLENCDKVTVSYNHFYHNYTRNVDSKGSGMTFNASNFDDTNGELILRNNMICKSEDKNSSQHGKGSTLIVYNVNKSFITNNTIAYNDSENKSTIRIHVNDINLQNRSVDIFNNIICGNNYNTFQMKLHGGFPPLVDLNAEVGYNSIEGLWYSEPTSVNLWADENDYKEPNFINTGNNNFHIQLGPCVDTGISPDPLNPHPCDDANITYSDIDMDRRPLNGDPSEPIQFDIGADEYKP